MSVQNILKNYGYIIYLLLITVINIFNFIYEIYFVSNIALVFSYIIYYLFALIGIYSFYKTDKSSEFCFAGLFLLIVLIFSFATLLFGNIMLFIPILALIPLIFIRKYHIVYKVLSSIIYLPLIISLFLAIFFADFGRTEIIDIVSSPNGMYNLVTIYSDQGALGCDIVLKLEKDLRIIKIRRTIEISNYSIDAEWVDNENIRINGKVIKVSLLP